jgi:hypothetical protein
VTGLGTVDDAFVQRCFELGSAEDGREQFAVIPLPDAATVAAVEWTALQPVREDQYARERQQIIRRELQKRSRQVVQEWMDPKLIETRNDFRFARGEG